MFRYEVLYLYETGASPSRKQPILVKGYYHWNHYWIECPVFQISTPFQMGFWSSLLIGYSPKSEKLETNLKLDVTLQPDLSNLDDGDRLLDMDSKEKPAYRKQFLWWVVKKYKNAKLRCKTGFTRYSKALAWKCDFSLVLSCAAPMCVIRKVEDHSMLPMKPTLCGRWKYH